MALPKHVHRVTKKRKGGETVYTFYTRYRNTKEAWPSIAMPEPLDRGFSTRLAICEAMERDAKGFSKRLPDLKDKDFWPTLRRRCRLSSSAAGGHPGLQGACGSLPG